MGGRGSSSGMGGGSAGGGGGSTWKFAGVSRVNNVSHDEAIQMYDAPYGTTVQMSSHLSGDYIGEYVRTASGWEGKQRYRSSYVVPPKVSSATGFAARVTGTDVKILPYKQRR